MSSTKSSATATKPPAPPTVPPPTATASAAHGDNAGANGRNNNSSGNGSGGGGSKCVEGGGGTGSATAAPKSASGLGHAAGTPALGSANVSKLPSSNNKLSSTNSSPVKSDTETFSEFQPRVSDSSESDEESVSEVIYMLFFSGQ
uniref:Uncharacterized protein n=1 Tax=Anopheles atroparvus TaxID=41427 RepID=A0A182JIX0_ANOAO